MEKIKRNKRGITLVALTITIIILLILTGITISTLGGENGLLVKVNQAAKLTKKSQYFEEINMEIITEKSQRMITAKEEAFIKSIQKRIENKNWVEQISATDSNFQKHENDYENTLLTIITKENYEILVDIENETLNATIRDNFEKIGNIYKVKYDANGGNGNNPEEQEVKVGFSLSLNENTYTKENYIFVGWSEDKAANNNTIYLPGSEYTPDKDTTLYAIWEKDIILTVNINTGKELTSDTEISIDATSFGSEIESVSIEGKTIINNEQYVRKIHNESILKTKIMNKNLKINDLNGSIYFNETYKINVIVKTTSKITKIVTLEDITDYAIRNSVDLERLANQVNAGNTFEGKTIYQTKDINIESNFTPIGYWDKTRFLDRTLFCWNV